MDKRILAVLLALLMVAPALPAAFTYPASAAAPEKVHPLLAKSLEAADADDEVVVVVRLVSPPADAIAEVAGNYELAVSFLKEWARTTQAPVIDYVEALGGEVIRTFWIDNVMLVRIKAGEVAALAAHPNVVEVFENFEVHVLEPVAYEEVDPDQSVASWGLAKIGVFDAWAQGATGKGVRIAVLDTGVDITHPALQGKMFTVDPNDPFYPGGWMEFNFFGLPACTQPYDSHYHGTHVSGTALGGDMQEILIGVAPEAKLMHGLVLPGGFGTFASVLAGIEWAVAPYDCNGNPTGYPAHVISMSLGASGYYGNYLLPAIANALLANVIVVAAIGNDGPDTSSNPGNIWGVYGIGATDPNDNVAWFSSGEVVEWPSPPDEWPFYDTYPQVYIKPDFSAPGVDIVSAMPGGWYAALSGTSMATPHVAGTVALVLQTMGVLDFDYKDLPETVYEILKNTSLDLGEPGQDTRYGWGRINASAAVALAKSIASGVEGYVVDAANGAPVPWAYVYIVEAGKNVTVLEDGSFKVFLEPGEYTLIVGAWGYESQTITVEVQQGSFAYATAVLDRLPYGTVTGQVVDAEDGAPVAGARVSVAGAPAYTYTGADGTFTLWLPEGTHELVVYSPEYYNETVEVTVGAGETVNLGEIPVAPKPRVAVLYDHQVAWLLYSNGVFALAYLDPYAAAEDIAAGKYDLLIWAGHYMAPFPSPDEFWSVINATREARINAIFLDSYGFAGYGIKALSVYTGDPAVVDYNWSTGDPVELEIVAAHPMLKDYQPGDVVTIIDFPFADYSWFDGFSGDILANTVVAGMAKGASIGVKYNCEDGTKWILMSSFAPTQWNSLFFFTDDAIQIMLSAVEYALAQPINVTLSKSEVVVGENVTVYVSGAAPNATYNVYLETELLGTLETDANGTGSFTFEVPMLPGGNYFVRVVNETLAQEGVACMKIVPNIEVAVEKATAPGQVPFRVTGLAAFQQFYVYVDSNMLTLLVANASGAYAGVLNLPVLASGNHSLTVVAPNGTQLASASICVTSQVDTITSTVANESAKLLEAIKSANATIVGVVTDEFGNLYAVLDTGFGQVIAKLEAVNGTIVDVVINSKGEIIAVVSDGFNTTYVKLGEIQDMLTQIKNTVDNIDATIKQNLTAQLEQVAQQANTARNIGLAASGLAIIALVAAGYGLTRISG